VDVTTADHSEKMPFGPDLVVFSTTATVRQSVVRHLGSRQEGTDNISVEDNGYKRDDRPCQKFDVDVQQIRNLASRVENHSERPGSSRSSVFFGPYFSSISFR